jgi:hypothetical protein
MRQLAIAIGLLSCVGCHNATPLTGSPAAPSLATAQTASGTSLAAEPPDPPRGPGGAAPALVGPGVLTFVSGESQLPVQSARVTIDGRSYVTDGAGIVAVDRISTAISVDATGFLERRALARTDHYSLWPRTSLTGIDEEYTARLVYNCASAGCVDGGESLGRVPQGLVTLQLSRDLLADRAAYAAIDEAAQLWTAATRGEVVFRVGAAFASGVVIVDMDVDPSDPAILARGAAGVTRRQYTGSSIARARITLRSVELARRLPLSIHELGHAFGLAHSPRVGDVMWNGPELYDATDLSEREKLSVALMLQRASGNRYPDTEDGLGGLRSASPRRGSIVACFEH